MPDNESTFIGEKLKDFFSKQGLTQQAIADRLGISQSAVSALLNGKPFGKKTAAKWGDEFGIQPYWLLTGVGEMMKSDTTNPNTILEKGGNISIPRDAWEVIRNQSASLKAKDEQINMLTASLKAKDEQMSILISQGKSGIDEAVQTLKGVISLLEKELAKKGEDAGDQFHAATRADAG